MRNYSYNWGRLLAVRWFVASWLLHGVHVLDKTERRFYVFFESLLLFAIFGIMYLLGIKEIYAYCIAFVALHTFTWLVDSHWLVGYREVDKNFHGKGIGAVIEFAEYTKKELSHFENVVAIGLYGSVSRKMFHDRSDLDLRVLQNSASLNLFWVIQKLRFIGIWKYKIPLDLKLVDSVEYLKEEMRIDEKPVMIFKKNNHFYNEGPSFEDLKSNPSEYLKETTLAKKDMNNYQISTGEKS